MSRQRFDWPTLLVGASAAAVLAFIYLPMIVVVVYSFNPEAVNSFPMRGASLGGIA